MRKLHLVTCLLVLFAGSAAARQDLWTDLSSRSSQESDFYRMLNMNTGAAAAIMYGTPAEIQLPLPDGSRKTFLLRPATILSPALQKKFPNLVTYNAESLDGKFTAKIDFNGKTLHATIQSPKGVIFVDPNDHLNPQFYKSYYVADYKNSVQKPDFQELPVVDTENKAVSLRKMARNLGRTEIANGANLRTYRLAVAADHQYSNFHGGTIENVLSAIVTTINRVNSIYERDLSITFQLVDDNDQIIFLDAADDPFVGLDTGEILTENTSTINSLIGSGNYDIGHSFTTGSGGLAGLGVVCGQRKAEGTTGINSPVGDAFDIDFVAHEIGHQFGGNHTFNGNQFSCAGGNRNASTAFEPGSGSTIMAYAGICGNDDLQNNSDAFFHSISLDEIIAYSTLSTGSTCPTRTPTNNTIPFVSADNRTYIIPANTPFELTATGTDADGDNLTYSWEQRDLGPSGSPSEPTAGGPLFRSFLPTESPTRTFPKKSAVLTNGISFGEVLPVNTREMNFRVVVRDNNPGAGAIATDDQMVLVTDQAGPFKLTSQFSSSTSYAGGTNQEVTWDVANTNGDEVNANFVNILLSQDGGENFDIVLAEMTRNDGVEQVLIPEIETTTARIKVEAVNNIFFAVNGRNFSITQATSPVLSLRVSDVPQTVCRPETAEFEITVNGAGGLMDDATLSVTGLGDNLSAAFSQSTVSPGETVTLSLSNTANATNTNNTFNVVATAGGLSASQEVTLTLIDGSKIATTLTGPDDGKNLTELEPVFRWEEVTGATSYFFQLATDADFENIVVSVPDNREATLSLGFPLKEATQYFWRVGVNNECGLGSFAQRSFTTLSYTYLVTETSTLVEIPEEGPAEVVSTLEITQDVVIDDVNITGLNISHSFISDIDVKLVSPEGTEVVLFAAICGEFEDINVSFDDQSVRDELPCPPPSNGEDYKPQSPLSAFIGENSKGTWKLVVTDEVNAFGGSINGWGLELGSIVRGVGLSLASVTTETATINWELLNTSLAITGYEVEIKADEDTEYQNLATVADDITSINITGLQPESVYQVRVRGQLAGSTTEYSNVIEILTIPNAPENFTLVVNNAGMIILTWLDNFNTELGFTLEFSTDGENFETLAALPPNTSSYLAESLDADLSYFFRVSTFNESGVSEFSEIISLMPTSNGDLLSSLRLYPNPGSNELHISPQGAGAVRSVSITDLSGKTVFRSEFASANNRDLMIHTAELKNGLYLVHVKTTDGTVMLKWIKE